MKQDKFFNNKMKIFILFAFLATFSILSTNIINSENLPNNDLCIHVFLDGGCPQCQSVLPYLEMLGDKYSISIKKYDISLEENKNLFKEFKENYGLKAEMYPTIFVGERYLIGEEPIRKALESEIKNCLDFGCPCPISKVRPYTPITAKPEDVTLDEKQTITVPLIGEVDLSSMSLGVVTALIAFVDGFNPCSLWVLTFLLGIVIYTGSRKKIILIGSTFLFVTTFAYGLFMLGLLNVFLYVGYLTWIKVVVASVAGIFAIVNIKDYFWYKKGISFTISDKYKPKMFRDIRKIMQGEGSTWAMISGTVIMALGIVLVELPCTAGFPVIWTSIIAEHNITGISFVMLFLLYMLIYLLDELVVFGTVAFTLKASKFEEKHGRILKLIGGMIMLALAIILIVKPELMNDIRGALSVFGIAIIVSFIILLLHRKILPKYGIKIGTEELKSKTFDKENKKENLKNKKELDDLGEENKKD